MLIVEILLNFSLFLLVVTSFYCLGTVVVNAVVSQSQASRGNRFYKLTVGIFLPVFIVSLTVTSFKTVHSFFVVPIGLWWYLEGRNWSFVNPFRKLQIKREAIELLKVLALSIPIFGFAAYTTFKSGPLPLKLPNYDYIAYIEWGSAILKTGNENYFGNANALYPERFGGLSPYHYFELWLNNIISETLRYSYLKTLVLLTYPLLQVTCLVGVISLLERFQAGKKSLVITGLIGFGLMFIQPLYSSYFENFELTKYAHIISNSSALSLGRKYLPGIVLVLHFFYMVKTERRTTACIVLSCLPILSISYLPATALGFGGFLLLMSFYRRSKPLLLMAFYVSALCLSILVFYRINAVSEVSGFVAEGNFLTAFLENPSLKVVKRFVFKVAFPFFRVALFSTPYFILIIILARQSKTRLTGTDKELILITVFMLSAGAIGAGLAYDLLDAGQLFTSLTPFLNILIIFLITRTLSQQPRMTSVLLFAALSLYNVHRSIAEEINRNQATPNNRIYHMTDFFMYECLKEIESKTGPIGYLYSDSDSRITHGRAELYSSPGYFLAYSNKNPMVLCLSNPKLIDASPLSAYYKTWWPFYHYYQDNVEMRYDQLLKTNIVKLRTEHLLIQGNEPPAVIADYVQLLLYDSESDFGFYQVDLEGLEIQTDYERGT